MNLAITGAAGVVGRILTPALSERHTVSPTDIRMAPGPRMIVRADVLRMEDMVCVCEGMDAVIHLAQAVWLDELSEAENDRRIMETRLKGLYNVLKCAAEAGVKRVVHISDLSIFNGYEEPIMVSEDFIPLPDTSSYQQSVYLSELVAREFARNYPGMILTLRIGRVVHEESLAPDAPMDYDWIEAKDMIEAVDRALSIERFDGMGHWGLYNLAADAPGSRYSLLKITSGQYGFKPAHRFESWWKEKP